MNIKIGRTTKQLTSYGGLIPVNELVQKSRLKELLIPAFKNSSGHLANGYTKFKGLMMGLIAGAECLEDMEKIEHDPGVIAGCEGKVYTAKSYGNFLGAFDGERRRELQKAGIDLALELRRQKEGKPADRLIFDVDSTPNRQYGKKMEGVAKSYKGFDCLDSLYMYDDLGFQYYCDVRPGNTHTSRGAEHVFRMLKEGLARSKPYSESKIWLRLDGGYYSSGILNACEANGFDVIVRATEKKGFAQIISQVHNWKVCEDSKSFHFGDGRPCEIGSTNYRLGKGIRRHRYVIIRALKNPILGLFGTQDTEYDYFAVCTSLDEIRLPDQEVILTYRKRGQAENYIKEGKYGFDLKHYPCGKLDSNKVYAIIAQYAYNYMRLLGLSMNDGKPCLVKKIRFQLITIPGTVARTGRDRIMRFMEKGEKEVSYWMRKIKNYQFGYFWSWLSA